MRPLAPVLWLFRRDPALGLALMLAQAGLVVVPWGNSGANSVWMAVPVFLAVAAFLMPVDSFLTPLPIGPSRVILARVLSVLTMVWLPFAPGAIGILLSKRPWEMSIRPAEFGGFFTVALLAAWTAVAVSTPLASRAATVLAAVAGAVSLALLPWAYIGAAIPLALIGAWVAAPADRLRSTHRKTADPGWIWLLLRSLVRVRWMAIAAAAVFLGLNLSWSLAPMLGTFLTLRDVRVPWLLPLPLPRRVLLWALLIPLMVPFLAAMAVGYRIGPRAEIADVEGATFDYYLATPGPVAPKIRAPWGETSQPPTQTLSPPFGRLQYIYNPYWVDGESSSRFIDWQLGRQARDIYGKEIPGAELSAAVRAGLRPLAVQSRMQLLTMAFGAAAILGFALLRLLAQSQKLRWAAPALRRLWPAAMVLTLCSGLYIPHKSISFDPLGGLVQAQLLRLSAMLPAGNWLAAVMALAPLALLYWMLEKVFNTVEIPDRTYQETA